MMRQETVTPRLRFVTRDGKRILQQAWTYSDYSADGARLIGGGLKWKDVPLETEEGTEE